MATLAEQRTRSTHGVLAQAQRFDRRKAARLTLLWILNVVFLFFFLFPFYWQTVTALKPPAELYSQPVRWVPSSLYWGHFQAVFTGFHFEKNIFNSVIVATATTVVSLVVGTLAAYALAKLPLPAKRTILVLVVAMVTLPGIALVASLFLVLRSLQLIDTYPALIIPYVAFSLPFAIWVLTNFFRDIPADLAEQAEVDGCTPFQSLLRVILPLAAPGLVTAALLIFIGAWNEFLFAFTFTSKPDTMTIPVAIYDFNGVHEIPWGEISAGSEMVTLPIIALVLIFQRRIVQGLTAGSLKG
jgi:multiple sugar transport system permease protein